MKQKKKLTDKQRKEKKDRVKSVSFKILHVCSYILSIMFIIVLIMSGCSQKKQVVQNKREAEKQLRVSPRDVESSYLGVKSYQNEYIITDIENVRNDVGYHPYINLDLTYSITIDNQSYFASNFDGFNMYKNIRSLPFSDVERCGVALYFDDWYHLSDDSIVGGLYFYAHEYSDTEYSFHVGILYDDCVFTPSDVQSNDYGYDVLATYEPSFGPNFANNFWRVVDSNNYAVLSEIINNRSIHFDNEQFVNINYDVNKRNNYYLTSGLNFSNVNILTSLQNARKYFVGYLSQYAIQNMNAIYDYNTSPNNFSVMFDDVLPGATWVNRSYLMFQTQDNTLGIHTPDSNGVYHIPLSYGIFKYSNRYYDSLYFDIVKWDNNLGTAITNYVYVLNDLVSFQQGIINHDIGYYIPIQGNDVFYIVSMSLSDSSSNGNNVVLNSFTNVMKDTNGNYKNSIFYTLPMSGSHIVNILSIDLGHSNEFANLQRSYSISNHFSYTYDFGGIVTNIDTSVAINVMGDVVSLVSLGLSGLAGLFGVNLFGSISIGFLLFMPLFTTILLFIVKLFKR